MLNKSELERAIRMHESRAHESYESCEKLAHLYALHDRYYGAQPQKNATSTDSELDDIFPALREYHDTRSISDFKLLCNEVEEFCNAVYVGTSSEEERNVYRQMVDRLRK